MNTNDVFSLTINTAATGARILHLLQGAGYTRQEVMDALGVTTTQTFYKWRHGQSIPSTDNLVRISAMLGIPINGLLVVQGLETTAYTDTYRGSGDDPGPSGLLGLCA